MLHLELEFSIKDNSTDIARNYLKDNLDHRYFENYIDRQLAGDFAFMLANELKKLKIKSVFEIVEHTSEEVYHPIGIYPTYEEAKGVIDEANSKNEAVYDALSYDAGEYEVIQILEREFGNSENGNKVYECKREYDYRDDIDEYAWDVSIEIETTKS